MKKIILALLLLLSFGVIIGCGDDDGDGPGPNTGPTRVVALSSATAPSSTNPADTVWNAATAATFDVSATNVLGGHIANLSSSVDVKAIVSGGRLYVRLAWDDATHNVWRDCYVISAISLTTPPYMTFTTPQNQIPMPEEDQVLLVFNDPAGAMNPDVWNWRALTTGGGGVAEGMMLNANGDSLIADDQPNSLKVAFQNIQGPGFASEPFCVHPDFFDYDGYLVYINDKVCKSDSIWNGTDSVTWQRLDGWAVGDSIPGYFIDSLILQSDANRGSRWDIDAGHTHSAAGYSLVMSRDLNTGEADDLDLSALPGDSVQVQIGLFDNQSNVFEGTSRRGYTREFWLILP